jgi:lipopolysaccharide/colanic/teichoic acid biosynthesis glycosyltransferase
MHNLAAYVLNESTGDHLMFLQPSGWSTSNAKRFFDLAAVVATLPITIPILLLVGLAVRLSSRGPVLFVQTRMGQHGRCFKIFKFRTMVHSEGGNRPLVTTLGNQRFTSIGRFLRSCKVDELPQLLNVLRGDMSLVGPRPKVPCHQGEVLAWRPGITGAATLVFAREAVLLDRVPQHVLDRYVQRVVLPAKRQIDAEYMYRATFGSDLAILIRTLTGCWDYTGAGSIQPLPEADPHMTGYSLTTRREPISISAETVLAED